MIILPRLRCPGCGKTIHAVKALVVPPAEKFEDCLRRCNKCRIGASNAKNPAKVRFIEGDPLPEPPPGQPQSPE